jgi:AraC-like DNA-binding protein
MPTERDPTVVHFVRPVSTPGLELVHYPRLTRGWSGVPEAYTWFTMIDRLEGSVDVVSRGIRDRCDPGSLTVGAPGESYALQPRTAMVGEFRVIRVDNRVRAEVCEEVGLRADEFSPLPHRDPSLAGSFDRLFEAIDGGSALEAHERVFQFVSALSARGSGGRRPRTLKDDDGIMRARELLHEGFRSELSLEELARAAGMDKFALLRTFSRKFGITPHAYQVQLRMARACQMIGAGVSLAEVAFAVGYSEQSALNRPFKRFVGVTPGQYARSSQSRTQSRSRRGSASRR